MKKKSYFRGNFHKKYIALYKSVAKKMGIHIYVSEEVCFPDGILFRYALKKELKDHVSLWCCSSIDLTNFYKKVKRLKK